MAFCSAVHSPSSAASPLLSNTSQSATSLVKFASAPFPERPLVMVTLPYTGDAWVVTPKAAVLSSLPSTVITLSEAR